MPSSHSNQIDPCRHDARGKVLLITHRSSMERPGGGGGGGGVAAALYHERQRRLCCGVHALNSLFQRPWVDAALLDALAARVAAEQGAGGAGAGAFRSWLPRLGNYDIGVLVLALQEGQGARLSGHLLANAALAEDLALLRETLLSDGGQRGSQQEGAAPHVQGLLVNIRSQNPWSRWLLGGRHWLALVRSPVDGSWCNVDSKLPGPEALGGVDAMLAFVRRCIEEDEGQAFVVTIGGRDE